MGPRTFQIHIWGPNRWPAPTKSGAHCNFCFYQNAADAPEAPHTQGVGGTRSTPKNFQPSRTTSMPNYIPIRPKVWTSIKNTHTSCPLYSRIWWGAFSKLVSIICWNVKKKLDINDQDFLTLPSREKKFYFCRTFVLPGCQDEQVFNEGGWNDVPFPHDLQLSQSCTWK